MNSTTAQDLSNVLKEIEGLLTNINALPPNEIQQAYTISNEIEAAASELVLFLKERKKIL